MNRIHVLHHVPAKYFILRKFCSNNGGKVDNIQLPPEPTTCCMSGCQNCVWVEYANELTKLLDDEGEQAREIILNKITDPSLKIFLRVELQNLESVRKKQPSD